MADERIEQREPPASLIALREELPKHPLIYNEAIKGRNFEECLATVAYMLDIALDGLYDVADLCDLLVKELRRQGAISLDGTSPSKVRDPRLVAATIVEMKDRIVIEKGTVEVQEVDGVERLGIVDEDAGTSVLLAEDIPFNAEPFLQEFEEPVVGKICGRCYEQVEEIFPANCTEKPEKLVGSPIGQYHCPDCGAMVLAGIEHPHLCKRCIDRTHPGFLQDALEKKADDQSYH